MRVLVIGGAGLLGRELCPRLCKAGHDVVICDNFTGSISFRTGKQWPVFTADAANHNSMSHVFSRVNPEIIIVASNFFFSPEIKYKIFDDTKMIINTANTLCSLLTPSVKQVIYCSSSEVYGGPDPRKPISEDRKIISPTNHRGSAFLAAERLLEFRCAELGIDLITARIFDLYGYRVKFTPLTGKVSFLIDSFLKRDQIGLAGARKKRDFIHAEDAADAFIGLLEQKFSGVVNIGTGEGTNLVELCREIGKHMRIYDPPVEVPDRKLTSYSAVADTSCLQETVSWWRPKHNIFDDIPDLLEFRRGENQFYSSNNAANVLKTQREG